MKTTVKVEGIERLQARLKDPALIQGPLKGLLNDAVNIGKREAETSIDGGTGYAIKSITAKVEPMEAAVFSMIAKERAMSIEEGRRPGEEIPWLQVANWMQGSRNASRDFDFKERREISLTREAIKMTGTKGKKFIEKAAQAVKSKMPSLVSDMAKKVEGRWARR